MTPSPTAPHSPTPWKLHDRYTDEVWSDGVCVCTTSEQNAALIVRAVNSHEGLVKALNEACESLRTATEFVHDRLCETVGSEPGPCALMCRELTKELGEYRRIAAIAEAGEECR